MFLRRNFWSLCCCGLFSQRFRKHRCTNIYICLWLPGFAVKIWTKPYPLFFSEPHRNLSKSHDVFLKEVPLLHKRSIHKYPHICRITFFINLPEYREWRSLGNCSNQVSSRDYYTPAEIVCSQTRHLIIRKAFRKRLDTEYGHCFFGWRRDTTLFFTPLGFSSFSALH